MSDGIPRKSIEDNFSDWEADTLGFGYGTGETFIVPALRRFLEGVPGNGPYDHARIEAALGGTTAWLLINLLCRADMIEYGTSPRFGWLTESGRALKAFFASKSDEQIIALCARGEPYVGCYRTACNCGPKGYVEARRCPNPFWD